jgi:hypothetical protein
MRQPRGEPDLREKTLAARARTRSLEALEGDLPAMLAITAAYTTAIPPSPISRSCRTSRAALSRTSSKLMAVIGR